MMGGAHPAMWCVLLASVAGGAHPAKAAEDDSPLAAAKVTFEPPAVRVVIPLDRETWGRRVMFDADADVAYGVVIQKEDEIIGTIEVVLLKPRDFNAQRRSIISRYVEPPPPEEDQTITALEKSLRFQLSRSNVQFTPPDGKPRYYKADVTTEGEAVVLMDYGVLYKHLIDEQPKTLNVFIHLKGMDKQIAGVAIDYKTAPEDVEGGAPNVKVPMNEKLDIAPLKKKAEEGDLAAMNDLGVAYARGTSVERDYKQAFEWYRKAAEAGHPPAMGNLGSAYCFGAGTPRNYDKAVEWYTKGAEEGDAFSMFGIGYMYEEGLGVPQDYEAAAAWYEEAAAKDSVEAMVNLGTLYDHGQGVAPDLTEAIAFYTKAADAGNATAMNNLGVVFRDGRGVAQDFGQAINWFKKSAGLGEPLAMFNLGRMIEQGQGLEKDERLAFQFYHKAASAEHPAGMAQVGICLMEGIGVAKDEREGRRWLKKAADAGDEVAVDYLAKMQENGE
jgi:hypothetical protein